MWAPSRPDLLLGIPIFYEIELYDIIDPIFSNDDPVKVLHVPVIITATSQLSKANHFTPEAKPGAASGRF